MPTRIPNLSRFYVPLPEAVCDEIASRKKYDRRSQVLPSVMEAIGDTPLVCLSRLAQHFGLSADTRILAKLEFFNAGGSVKDRIARSMVEYELQRHRYPESGVILEASSGNTGIGLAIAAAATGRECRVTMNENMAYEKEQVLRVLGADVIRTPTAPWYDERSHIGEACAQRDRLGDRAIFFNQYQHPANPAVHFSETAQELIEQTQGQIDFCVVGLGTCGTAVGLGSRLRRDVPRCKLVVVEPSGSVINKLQEETAWRHPVGDCEPQPIVTSDDTGIVALSKQAKPWKTEGIGKDFFPPLLDPALVDQWMVIEDARAFQVARAAARTEGLLIGGSSGAALAAALELGSGAGKGKRIVVVLPDSARNYLTTFFDDGWMVLHKFLSLDEVPISARNPMTDSTRLGTLENGDSVFRADPTENCATALRGAVGSNFLLTRKGGNYVGISVRDLTKRVMARERALHLSLQETLDTSNTICLLPSNTFLEAIHFIDEMERVWKCVDGFVLVATDSDEEPMIEHMFTQHCFFLDRGQT